MVVLNDCQQINLQKIRAKLQKYFYTPNFKQQQENRDVCRVTVTFKCKLCQKTFVKCRGAIRQRNTADNTWRFCKSCKYDLRKYFVDKNATKKYFKIKSTSKKILRKKEPSQTCKKLLVNPLLVYKLKQLGTTIMPEDIAKNMKFDQMPYTPIQLQNEENIVKINDKERINSTDILISFDKTVTEVFPLDLTKNEHYNSDHIKRKNINEVFKQIPKSISISVA